MFYIYYIARVSPTGVSGKTVDTTTTLHWDFDQKVEGRIKQFDVKFSSDANPINVSSVEPAVREYSRQLEDGVKYRVKVAAVYNDDFKIWSEEVAYTPPSM